MGPVHLALDERAVIAVLLVFCQPKSCALFGTDAWLSRQDSKWHEDSRHNPLLPPRQVAGLTIDAEARNESKALVILPRVAISRPSRLTA